MRSGKGWTITCLVLAGLFSHCLSAQERWVYRYNGPVNGYDEAFSIIVGGDNNLYGAGTSMGSGTSSDLFVVSLTLQGVERWIYRYNGSGDSTDLAKSITMGRDGNLYTAGQSIGSDSSFDLVVVSLDTSGSERWVYRYNGPANGFDEALSIVVGEDSNLYVGGKSTGIGTFDDLTVVSLDTSGAERWVYRYNGPGNALDRARSLLSGMDGNLYVPGYTTDSNEDFTVVSLTPQGQERWVYRYNGPGNWDDWATLAVMGRDGNLYVAGRSYGGPSDHDFTVISLDTSGAERWVYSYNGPGNGYDEALSIAVGNDSNLYVAGMSEGVGTSRDFTIVSLTQQGAFRWVYRYNGSGNDWDDARSIVTGGDNNLFVVGGSGGSGTYSDLIVASLSFSGTEDWVYRYNGPGNYHDWASSIALAEDSLLYVGGFSTGGGTLGDFTVISLSEDTGISDTNLIEPISPQLEMSVYPVPAIGEVMISFSLPEGSPVRFSIYDCLGRFTWGLVDPWEEAGPKTALWRCEDERGRKVAPGLYYIVLETLDESLIRKFVLLSSSK